MQAAPLQQVLLYSFRRNARQIDLNYMIMQIVCLLCSALAS